MSYTLTYCGHSSLTSYNTSVRQIFFRHLANIIQKRLCCLGQTLTASNSQPLLKYNISYRGGRCKCIRVSKRLLRTTSRDRKDYTEHENPTPSPSPILLSPFLFPVIVLVTQIGIPSHPLTCCFLPHPTSPTFPLSFASNFLKKSELLRPAFPFFLFAVPPPSDPFVMTIQPIKNPYSETTERKKENQNLLSRPHFQKKRKRKRKKRIGWGSYPSPLCSSFPNEVSARTAVKPKLFHSANVSLYSSFIIASPPLFIT